MPALLSIDASYYFWDTVWKKDNGVYTTLNILDTVQYNGTQITGWLFTATNGNVKSKLAANWKYENILSRCGNFNSDNIAYIYQACTGKWEAILNAEELYRVLGDKVASRTAIVCHPYLKQSARFLEVEYDHRRLDGRFSKPKFSHTWLIDSRSKGKVHDRNNRRGVFEGKEAIKHLPTDRLISKSKQLNRQASDYLLEMVRILESKHRGRKVTRMTAVVTLVDAAQLGCATSVGVGSVGVSQVQSAAEAGATPTYMYPFSEGPLGEGNQLVFLHHIVSMTLDSASSESAETSSVVESPGFDGGGAARGGEGGGGLQRQTSSASMMSELSTSIASTLVTGSSAIKTDNCQGDFCQCVLNGAERGLEGTGADGVDSQAEMEYLLDDYEDFDINREAYKAVNRHRRVNSEEYLAQRGEDAEGTSGDAIDVMPTAGHYDGETALDSAAGANMTAESNQGAGRGGVGGGINREQMRAALEKKMGLVRRGVGKKVKLPPPVRQYKVMGKSIALARQEMSEIEARHSADIAMELGGGSVANFAAGAGSLYTGSKSKIWPPNIMRWWLNVGRTLPKSKTSFKIPSSSAHNIDIAVLGNKASCASTSDGASSGGKADAGAPSPGRQGRTKKRHNGHEQSSTSADAASSVASEAAGSHYSRTTEAHSLHVASKQEGASAVGQVSWYYSSVPVCERCQEVYSELDRQRRLRHKHLFQLQRQELSKEEGDAGDLKSWRDVEERIFKQRQNMTRLAQADAKKHQGPRSLQQQRSALYDGGVGGIAAHSKLGGKHLPAAMVPSRALPPLPWNLSEKSRSEAYARTSDSILTRRILERGPDRPPLPLPQQQGQGAAGDPEYVDSVLQQWSQLTRPQQQQHQHHLDGYEGHPGQSGHGLQRIKPITKKKKQQAKAVTVGGDGYNESRLLHQWQRDLNKMKAGSRDGGSGGGGGSSSADDQDLRDMRMNDLSEQGGEGADAGIPFRQTLSADHVAHSESQLSGSGRRGRGKKGASVSRAVLPPLEYQQEVNARSGGGGERRGAGAGDVGLSRAHDLHRKMRLAHGGGGGGGGGGNSNSSSGARADGALQQRAGRTDTDPLLSTDPSPDVLAMMLRQRQHQQGQQDEQQDEQHRQQGLGEASVSRPSTSSSDSRGNSASSPTRSNKSDTGGGTSGGRVVSGSELEYEASLGEVDRVGREKEQNLHSRNVGSSQPGRETGGGGGGGGVSGSMAGSFRRQASYSGLLSRTASIPEMHEEEEEEEEDGVVSDGDGNACGSAEKYKQRNAANSNLVIAKGDDSVKQAPPVVSSGGKPPRPSPHQSVNGGGGGLDNDDDDGDDDDDDDDEAIGWSPFTVPAGL